MADNKIKKAKPALLKRYIAHSNIAELLPDDKLSEIGGNVVQEYHLDDQTRSEKSSKWEESQKLFNQVVEYKNTPFDNASNVKYPLLTSACVQFNAKAYPAIVPSGDIVRPKINGKVGGEQGENAAKFMSWQLTYEDPDWEPDTDRLTLILPCWGTAFRKRWFSTLHGRPASKLLTPDRVVVNNACKSLETAPRISELFTLYPNDIMSRIRGGLFLDINYEDGGDSDNEIEFIEQHRWEDLDDDGYKEPYIVTVEKSSGSVARITACYDEDGITVNDKGHVASIRRVNYYTKYEFIPSIDNAFYGIGFCDILYPLNESINTTVNQLLDAGRLANLNTGFIAKDLRIGKGAIKAKIGEWTPVNARSDDLRKGLVQMQFPGPSMALFQLMGFLVDSAKDVANLKDVLMGEQAGNLPVGTMMALVEQGMKVFGTIFKRIRRSLQEEMAQLKRINSIYLNDDIYAEVLDKKVSKADFIDDGMDFEPVVDPGVVTDMQKMAKAQYIGQFVNDPFFDPIKVREAMLDAANIEAEGYLKPPDERPSFEQQKTMMELQVRLAELELKKAEQARKDRQTDADIQESTANAIDKLAQAEQREVGNQLGIYKAEVDKIDQSRRMERVGSSPSNPGIPTGINEDSGIEESGLVGGQILGG